VYEIENSHLLISIKPVRYFNESNKTTLVYYITSWRYLAQRWWINSFLADCKFFLSSSWTI